jgi:MFS family permease
VKVILEIKIRAVSTEIAIVPVLIIGRLVQTVAGSLIWIIGMAILADTVGVGNLAKALGFTYMFVSAGLLSGPAVSGTLYALVSYSLTWTVAFVAIALGLILQLLMIPPTKKDENTLTNNSFDGDSVDSDETVADTDRDAENNPLIQTNSPAAVTYQSLSSIEGSICLENSKPPQPATHNVYYLMLRQSRVSTALAADILFAMIISSFETTIPLHIKLVFKWDSLQAGILFLLLQVPSVIFVLPAGWMKDKIGMRYPVTIGFLLTAPSLWLLGVAGNDSFPWANTTKVGEVIYLTALVGLGTCRTLLLGFGGVEVMRKCAG